MPRRHPRLAPVLVAILAALMAAPAPLRAQPAQVLRGSLADSATRRPVVGVVVSMLDSTGRVLASTLSDTAGRYRILRTAEARRVRAQRIGFRALERRLETGVDWVDLTLPRLPTLLETRRVTAAECGAVRRDAGTTITLIEQARAGLLATSVAREQHPATVTVLTYERSMEDAETSARMRVEVAQNSRTGRSFGAASDAADFVNHGFRGVGPDAGMFYAPDADVLLDDAFSANYCYRLERGDAARPDQVGLGFEAAKAQRGRVDVDGTLWIDTLARELRGIEFRYVGLTAMEESFRPGGTIHFRTMPNGIVFVDRWSLSLVGAAVDTLAVSRSGALLRSRVRRFPFLTGGELARAEWPDGTAWRGELGTARLRAVWRDGTPARDVLLELRDTPYAVRTDSVGRAELGDLLPGPYSVTIPDSLLEAVRLEIPTSLRFTSARDTVTREVVVPTLADFVADACAELGRGPRPNEDVFVLARAFSPAGAPRENVRYTVRRRARAAGEAASAWEELASAGRTGSDGIIPWCRGLRLHDEIEIQVTGADAKVLSPRVTLGSRVTILPIVIP